MNVCVCMRVRVCVCPRVRVFVCAIARVCVHMGVHMCVHVCGLKTSPSKTSAGVIACNINRITMEEITQHVFILVRLII